MNSQISDDAALNDYFDDNGYESKIFLKNIGSSIVYFLVYLHMWLAIGISNIIGIWS